MMITKNYDEWLENCKSRAGINSVVGVKIEVVASPDFCKNFKGYMITPASIDSNGNQFAAKSRIIHDLNELQNYDFSECYLYSVEQRTTSTLKIPDGMTFDQVFASYCLDPKSVEFEELSTYIIRFAGQETLKVNA